MVYVVGHLVHSYSEEEEKRRITARVRADDREVSFGAANRAVSARRTSVMLLRAQRRHLQKADKARREERGHLIAREQWKDCGGEIGGPVFSSATATNSALPLLGNLLYFGAFARMQGS